MSNDNQSFTFNFYGNVGQNIANVEKLEAHFDKDATMTIAHVDNAEIKQPQATTTRKPRAAKQGTKYTQATFEYKYLAQQHIRIVRLFQMLSKGKVIAVDTTPDDFCQIFEGKPSNAKVKWLRPQSFLYSLIRQLKQKELITIPQGTTVWQITESHFIDKNSRPFRNFNKQKDAKRALPTIEKLVAILDPSIPYEA